MAATFAVKNGSWQCIGNKEIRERELDDCDTIRHFANEKETDPLRMFKVHQSMDLDIGLDIQCSEKTASFSYQACDGVWKPLGNSSSVWGLQVTKHTSNSEKNYMLEIYNANRSKDLQGKVMKLSIPCGSANLPLCWLFKISGYVTCPLKHILATSIPSKTRTTTTTEAATAATTTTTTTKAVFSTKHAVLTATKVPISFISTYKATNPRPTDSDIETINEASHEVSIPLITGVAGSAVIVLLVALIIGLLVCRKRRERHSRKRSTCLELKTTKTDDCIDQYSLVEEKARYQSLSPSPDGAMERGVYVSRYKVPETTLETNNCYTLPEGQDPCRPVDGPKVKPDCDEYDYAQSSLVVRKNVLKFSFAASNEKDPNTPEDNVPFYHVLDGEDRGLQIKESSEDDCGKPDEGAPYYRVLEGPNSLDPPDNTHEQDHEGAHNETKEQDP
ncbi:uncharacterized protein LOC144628320 [Oculina patagonica]